MKLVNFPYRWRASTIWKNIDHALWDLRSGVRNLYRFFWAVWWFRSFDYTGMLELLEVSAREMRKCQEHGLHAGADRYARQLLVVETMCKRLCDDNYFDNAGHDRWDDLTEFEKTKAASHSTYMAKQDAEYLGKTLKFVQHWWD